MRVWINYLRIYKNRFVKKNKTEDRSCWFLNQMVGENYSTAATERLKIKLSRK